MIEVSMPWKSMPLFIVVNYKNMYTGSDLNKYNAIILNGFEVDELIERFSKNLESSRKFIYWLCFINSIEAIDNMKKLTSWMGTNGFQYRITNEQLKMYYETAILFKTLMDEESIE
jgi:hypothetical protein